MTHTLILGGIRSGKSALAEAAVAESLSGREQGVVYVATGEAGDQEMAERIRVHRERRPADWGLVEEPLCLGSVLNGLTATANGVLIDCMSLWLSNLLHAGDAVLEREWAAFLDELERYPGNVVIVSNEVGLGTIGMDSLTRRYCDQLGWLNQALAARCERVQLCVAGLPLTLKGDP